MAEKAEEDCSECLHSRMAYPLDDLSYEMRGFDLVVQGSQSTALISQHVNQTSRRVQSE